MAKKKSQNSRSSRTNSKESNIESSSLLPARSHGERPDMVFSVKKEQDDDIPMETDVPINEEIKDLFQGIADVKNTTVLCGDAHSNQTQPSTYIQPMDTDEQSVNDSHQQSSTTENHMAPISFAQELVKQEMRMPEVPSNQVECFTPLNASNITAADQSNVKESLSNDHVENSSENNVATPIRDDQVKQEPVENNENSQDNSIQNITNAQINVKTEPLENHENATKPLENHENVAEPLESRENVAEPLENHENLAEPVENHENATELEKKSNEKLPTKRKSHLELKLEFLRKRIKTEPNKCDENERIFSCDQNNETQQEDINGVLLNEISGISHKVRKEMLDVNDNAEDAVKEEIIDHDIAVLTVPKIKKNIETITLSDDEDPQNAEEQDIEMECYDVETSVPTNSNIPNIHCNIPVQPSTESLTSQPSNSGSPKKLTNERKFSTDILSYFSVVSELDRYDCQACLDSLQKKKINNSLTNFFPSVKRERKTKDEIQKGDILFKKITTETHSGTKRTPISQNNIAILQDFPVQSRKGKFSELFSSSLLPVETCSTQNRAQVSQNVDYNIPEKLQAAVNFQSVPTSHVLSNLFQTPTPSLEVNQSPNSWSTNSLITNSETIESNINQLLNWEHLRDFIPDFNKKEAASDQNRTGNSNQFMKTTGISPQAPLGNVVSQTITSLHNHTSQIPSYSVATTVDQNHIENSNQLMKTTVISPQAPLGNAASQRITPSRSHTSQMPSYSVTTTVAAAVPSSSVSTISYLPAVPCISARSQEAHDSRHTVNKPIFPSSNIESSIQNKNTAVVQPQTSFQAVTRLSNNAQSESRRNISNTASNTAAPKDPRTAANKIVFPPRKGDKNLPPLYLNIGKDYITQHFDDLILQWNPEWLQIQQNTNSLPPISETYKSVVYFYSNEMDYYNTYVPLHLLHIWHNIFHCWTQRPHILVPNCIVQSVERLDKGYKISFSAVLVNTLVLPKNDDIVWYKGKEEEAFLRVEDVKRKTLEHGLKLRMTLHTLVNLQLNLDDEVSFVILWNTRAAYLQAEALNSLDNSMKELVLKPTNLLSRIEIVQLNNHNKKIKEQRDDILKVVILPQIRVVVIETYYGHGSVLLLTQIAFNILLTFNGPFSEKHKLSSRTHTTTKKQSKVLIILKNDSLLERLYKSLSQYEPILAVRTKQINLSPELVKYTIEDCLETKQNMNKISQDHHIYLTTVSAFGSNEKNLLAKMKDLICIIDDAHLCTEVETALPLTLKISKLLLIGSKDRNPVLPQTLQNYKYHITFFVRLLKAKRWL